MPRREATNDAGQETADSGRDDSYERAKRRQAFNSSERLLTLCLCPGSALVKHKAGIGQPGVGIPLTALLVLQQ